MTQDVRRTRGPGRGETPSDHVGYPDTGKGFFGGDESHRTDLSLSREVCEAVVLWGRQVSVGHGATGTPRPPYPPPPLRQAGTRGRRVPLKTGTRPGSGLRGVVGPRSVPHVRLSVVFLVTGARTDLQTTEQGRNENLYLRGSGGFGRYMSRRPGSDTSVTCDSLRVHRTRGPGGAGVGTGGRREVCVEPTPRPYRASDSDSTSDSTSTSTCPN